MADRQFSCCISLTIPAANPKQYSLKPYTLNPCKKGNSDVTLRCRCAMIQRWLPYAWPLRRLQMSSLCHSVHLLPHVQPCCRVSMLWQPFWAAGTAHLQDSNGVVCCRAKNNV